MLINVLTSDWQVRGFITVGGSGGSTMRCSVYYWSNLIKTSTVREA